jgi:undecaprenyl-diphosphatase
LLTTAPALVAGYFAHSTIKAHLFNPESVALALGVGGIAILVVERISPRSEIHSVHDMTWKHALVVGLFQCLSLWPGVSRAAATILGGLLTKLDRQTAAEYSFLAAVPVMTAATAYDLMKNWNVLTIDDIWFFGLGFVLSFISAAVTVKLFISLLQRWSFEPFGWYRVLIAPLVYYLWK